MITPEHDQSRVTQCKVYEGIGETIVCHKIVKIARIDKTNETALIGGGILRRMFTIRINDAKTISRTITVMNGMGLKLMGTSKVGPFPRPLEMNKLWGTPAKERIRPTMLACQIQKLNPLSATSVVKTIEIASPTKKCSFWILKVLEHRACI